MTCYLPRVAVFASMLLIASPALAQKSAVYEVTDSGTPKTPRNRVFFRIALRCWRKVSASRDSMAERVGFEPTVPLQVHLISNQARSTGLRHLSAAGEASRIPSVWATPVRDRRILVSTWGRFAALGPSC